MATGKERRYTKVGWRGRLDMRTVTMVAVLLVLWIGFTAFTSEFFQDMSGSFLTARNLSNLIRAMSVIGVLACGMVLVIVSGGIDLSVGTLAGTVGCAAAAMQVYYGWSTPTVVVVCLLMGAVGGLAQGALIAYFSIAAFIVTLGGQLVFRGFILFITRGQTIAPLDASFRYMGQGYFRPAVGWSLTILAIAGFIIVEIGKRRAKIRYDTLDESRAFTTTRCVLVAAVVLASMYVLHCYRGMPVPVFIMLFLMLLLTFIAEKTPFGRSIYAIGGNLPAAIYSGLNVKVNLALVYCLNGVMAAVAGLILTARLNAGPTTAASMNMELDAIAGAVIGGTSMTGGVGKVVGAILGATIMATIDNGMSLLNLSAAWQFLVKGVILVAAVLFDMRTQKKKKL